MPRKTDGIEFEIHPRPTKGEDGKISGLKRDSAKAYLDSLCKGEHPRLWKVRESRRWLYFPKQDTSKE